MLTRAGRQSDNYVTPVLNLKFISFVHYYSHTAVSCTYVSQSIDFKIKRTMVIIIFSRITFRLKTYFFSFVQGIIFTKLLYNFRIVLNRVESSISLKNDNIQMVIQFLKDNAKNDSAVLCKLTLKIYNTKVNVKVAIKNNRNSAGSFQVKFKDCIFTNFQDRN